jgi:multiple sugar transport system ATP-binding protein
MNLMPCREEGGQLSLLSASIQKSGIPATGKGVAWLGVRPEHITLCDPKQGMLAGKVMVTEYLGSEQYVYVDCGFEDVTTVRIDPAEECTVGSDVGLMLAHDALHLFDEGESRL